MGSPQPATQRLSHIPYRNSKLTMLLKDSLGGNAKTMMIATIRLSAAFYQQTLTSLQVCIGLGIGISISLGFKGLFLYTGDVLLHMDMECCIRQLWCCFSILLYNITSIAYKHHTDILISFEPINIYIYISHLCSTRLVLAISDATLCRT